MSKNQKNKWLEFANKIESVLTPDIAEHIRKSSIEAREGFDEGMSKRLTRMILNQYENGNLTIGQVSDILDISKNETIDLLKKYNIAFVNADEKYLEQEFNAFK